MQRSDVLQSWNAGCYSAQVLGQGPCDVANIQCMGTAKSGSTKLPVCAGMDTLPAGCLPNVEKKYMLVTPCLLLFFTILFLAST